MNKYDPVRVEMIAFASPWVAPMAIDGCPFRADRISKHALKIESPEWLYRLNSYIL